MYHIPNVIQKLGIHAWVGSKIIFTSYVKSLICVKVFSSNREVHLWVTGSLAF